MSLVLLTQPTTNVPIVMPVSIAVDVPRAIGGTSTTASMGPAPPGLTLTARVVNDGVVLFTIPSGALTYDESYFTTVTWPLVEGYVAIQWLDGATVVGEETWLITAAPLEVPETFPWSPTSADVAALMFSRVTGEYQGVIEDFTETTRPTLTQVETFIASATGVVAARVGFVLDPRFDVSAQFMATLYTALLLEPGYWMEQQRPDKSAWDQWKALYDEGMPPLIDAIAQAGAGEDPGPADADLSPIYAFPLPPVYEW